MVLLTAAPSAPAALSKSSLKARIKTELQTAFYPILPTDSGLLDKVSQGLANAIVDEITANAQTTVPGVQTGGSTVIGTVQ